jgi:hypothetical protein
VSGTFALVSAPLRVIRLPGRAARTSGPASAVGVGFPPAVGVGVGATVHFDGAGGVVTPGHGLS